MESSNTLSITDAPHLFQLQKELCCTEKALRDVAAVAPVAMPIFRPMSPDVILNNHT